MTSPPHLPVRACGCRCIQLCVHTCIRACVHSHKHTIFTVGKTGFAEHAVRSAWKAANAGDGSENNVSSDKDKLKLDWHEYQTCIRILAKRAGVSLATDAPVEEIDRYFGITLSLCEHDEI